MQYSIVIPVFNKADLTFNCLRTLRETLEGAGEGEVIVIDNASSDRTPQMLTEFPWVRVVRNDRNLGFAGANNQGARLAGGEFLVLLNNDTQAKPGWLAAMLRTASAPDVGAVGARLLFPDRTLQHAGVVISAQRFGSAGFLPTHDLHGAPANTPQALMRREFQVVTAACMVTPRELYLKTGGLDEGYWNGYEDVDYCLRLGSMGLRVIYEPEAVLTHFESQSGPQRFRRVVWNVGRLAKRWNGAVRFDANALAIERGMVSRLARLPRGFATNEVVPIPAATIVVHGEADPEQGAIFMERLHDHHVPIDRIVHVPRNAALSVLREELEHRGDRYVAVVDARCVLDSGWLDELVRQLQFAPASAAATYAPELPGGENVAAFTADARCTLLHAMKFPQHLRLGDFPTLNGALADFLIQGIGVRAGTRGAAHPIAQLPALEEDAQFEQIHGMRLSQAIAADSNLIERALRSTPGRRTGLVSIVMLSWNAPQFTKLALESIRAHTQGEYEIVIVDNGSGPETVEWLETLTDVRVIYNPHNRGFAGGNNQALAAARGEYVVLLNNDVIVTENWLEGLLRAFDRIPGLGVSAPRSNKIAGDQIVVDASYSGMPEMHEYAARRRMRYRDSGYITDRAIGLCLCIDRRVIVEVGGIDERFGVGNFEDDDFCLRVRAAGYRIFVCDDVFIHHFGSQTFAANKIDWTATMRENWSKFAAKWDLPPQQVGGGYSPTPAIRRGFVRARHYVALPAPPSEAAKQYDLIFTAVVTSESDWEDVGAFARRYARAFAAGRPVLLAIAALGEPDARAIGTRIERFAHREGLNLDEVADIEVSDETQEAAWRAGLPPARHVDVAGVADRSPSALRRYVQSMPV